MLEVESHIENIYQWESLACFYSFFISTDFIAQATLVPDKNSQ